MPLTKEEIYEGEFGLLSIKPTNTVKQCALNAMDEYAKQISLAYDEWKWDNRWYSFENGFWYQTLEHPCAMSDKTYNKYHRKTPQELYNQFIEQQNKQQ